jgi:hypothetical protein
LFRTTAFSGLSTHSPPMYILMVAASSMRRVVGFLLS